MVAAVIEQYYAIVATTPSYTQRRLAPPLPEDYLSKLNAASSICRRSSSCWCLSVLSRKSTG